MIKPEIKSVALIKGERSQNTKTKKIQRHNSASTINPSRMMNERIIAPSTREMIFQPSTRKNRSRSKPRPYPEMSRCHGANSLGKKNPIEKKCQAQAKKLRPISIICPGAVTKNQRKKMAIVLSDIYFCFRIPRTIYTEIPATMIPPIMSKG